MALPGPVTSKRLTIQNGNCHSECALLVRRTTMGSRTESDLATLDGARDLTSEVRREGRELVAMGGFSSVWRTVWQPKGTTQIHEVGDHCLQLLQKCLRIFGFQVVVKLLRASHSDKDTAERKLLKVMRPTLRTYRTLRYDPIVAPQH